ncbi:ADP-ribose pyrophosphatase [Luminiphilus syltensis NOR5-1B]|uniref:ADP-ribose pyrophosphatase n=1 Tax=Luminiphilus syltensis NOR5-1B TaxID=565045 RepID=B8KX08_9GAMM|nr:NUDIX domain-containing protein [Luminiphilus syltensis]EED36796.1 ADP-ribose pyrophosphatase [Luminiphilus syltensis NOR5-1B]
MSALLPTFGADDVETLESEQVFQGYFSLRRDTLRHRRFNGGWTAPFRREVFDRGDAVGVLPWDPVSDQVILIEQFRPGAMRGDNSPWMFELIAGIVEPNEDDETVAHREAEEEAGCHLDRLRLIHTFYPSAGGCSEQIRLFMGRLVAADVGAVRGVADEFEDILVHTVSRTNAIAWLDANKIDNGHTLIALQWLARHGETLRQEWLK